MSTVGLARWAGVAIAGATGGGVVITFVAAAGITFLISETADYLDAQISQGKLNSILEDYAMTELAIVGNLHYSGDTVLKGKDITLIGNHHFENLEVNSDNLTVIGELKSESRLIINNEHTETINTETINSNTISADFMKNDSNQSTDTEKIPNAENNVSDSKINEAESEPHSTFNEPLDSTDVLYTDTVFYSEELKKSFADGSFDIAGTHLRVMEGTASKEDSYNLAAYEHWLSTQTTHNSNAAHSPLTDTPTENLIQ